MKFFKEKNLKLNPKKFFIGEQVEFGGSSVTADFISPKEKRIKACEELSQPQKKKSGRFVWTADLEQEYVNVK